MDFLLETAISAFFLAGILAIAFLFFWRARAVERQIGLLMKAALTNTKDIRHCTDAINGGFQQLGKSENHHRALLASLNSQISNLGSMLEAGYARPENPVSFAPPEQERVGRDKAGQERSGQDSAAKAGPVRSEPANAERVDQVRPLELETLEPQLTAVAANQSVARVAPASSKPVVISSPADLAKPFDVFGNKDGFGSFGNQDAGLPGFRSVRNRSADRFTTSGGHDAGHQRKLRTIDELFRKIELPRATGADKGVAADAESRSNVSTLHPTTPPSFADLVSQRRRVANG